MAIKISGTTVINDDSNIINVGVVTVGTGGTDGRVQVGTGATIHGSGDVAIAGTVYAFDLVTPLKVESFSPDDGQTNVLSDIGSIEIAFNNAIGLGTTGYVIIEDNSGVFETFAIGSTLISRTGGNRTLKITPSTGLPKGLAPDSNVIIPVVQSSFLSNEDFTGINTTGGMATYSFTMADTALGEEYGGGYLICASGGTQWIVAPFSTESGNNWYNRNQAVTCAQAYAPCGDWFVPSLGQLQNPGHTCRTYWDGYSNDYYWSSSQRGGQFAWKHQIANGQTFPYQSPFSNMGTGACLRAFRTISY
jgi:hypothetical protein